MFAELTKQKKKNNKIKHNKKLYIKKENYKNIEEYLDSKVEKFFEDHQVTEDKKVSITTSVIKNMLCLYDNKYNTTL